MLQPFRKQILPWILQRTIFTWANLHTLRKHFNIYVPLQCFCCFCTENSKNASFGYVMKMTMDLIFFGSAFFNSCWIVATVALLSFGCTGNLCSSAGLALCPLWMLSTTTCPRLLMRRHWTSHEAPPPSLPADTPAHHRLQCLPLASPSSSHDMNEFLHSD